MAQALHLVELLELNQSQGRSDVVRDVDAQAVPQRIVQALLYAARDLPKVDVTDVLLGGEGTFRDGQHGRHEVVQTPRG